MKRQRWNGCFLDPVKAASDKNETVLVLAKEFCVHSEAVDGSLQAQ